MKKDKDKRERKMSHQGRSPSPTLVLPTVAGLQSFLSGSGELSRKDKKKKKDKKETNSKIKLQN